MSHTPSPGMRVVREACEGSHSCSLLPQSQGCSEVLSHSPEPQPEHQTPLKPPQLNKLYQYLHGTPHSQPETAHTTPCSLPDRLYSDFWMRSSFSEDRNMKERVGGGGEQLFPVITAFQSKGLGRRRKPAGECRVCALHRKWPRLRLLRKNMVVPAKKRQPRG